MVPSHNNILINYGGRDNNFEVSIDIAKTKFNFNGIVKTSTFSDPNNCYVICVSNMINKFEKL